MAQRDGAVPHAVSAPAVSNAPAGGAPRSPKGQSLSLKVMRLSKLAFQSPRFVPCEHTDLPFKAIDEQRSALDANITECVVSSNLMLPGSFGSIYLGETFTSYISMFNSSADPVTSLSMKAELRSPSQQRHTLMELTTEPGEQFVPAQSHDCVVRHHIQEEGTHILICTANYLRHDGEKKFFRKFYKFVVESPFALASHVRRVQDCEMLIELKLKNVSKGALMLERADFVPASDVYEIHDFNKASAREDRKKAELSGEDEDDELEGIEQRLAKASTPFMGRLRYYIKPGEVRQLLYKITSKEEMPDTSVLGRVNMRWQSVKGGAGSMTSADIDAPPLKKQDIELTLEDIPSKVVVEQPFSVQCRVRNCSGRTIQPQLFITVPPHAASGGASSDGGIVVMGLNTRSLPTLPPGQTAALPLSLFPLRSGVQRVSGLQIVDPQQQTVFKFSNIAEIFVASHCTSR